MDRLIFFFRLLLSGYFLAGFVFTPKTGLAQLSEKEQKAIIDEGYELYRLELASWNSSDLLTSIWGISTLDSIEGYLSYRQGNAYNTIYYGGEKEFRIYANFVFDSLSSIQSAIMDLTPRAAAHRETQLITMRTDALERIGKNEGNFFEPHEKTSFNLIPMITANERKVIVLCGPQETGNVLFGNDYVLEYGEDNKFKAQTRLHGNLSVIPMETTPDSLHVFATAHTHAHPASGYITPTDICTLLLYGDYTNWEQHSVISENYFSIWDLKKKTLRIVASNAAEKTEKIRQEKKKN